MKLLSAALLTVFVSASAGAAAENVNWTQWTPGTTATGIVHQNGFPIVVEYSGSMLGLDFDASFFANTVSFTHEYQVWNAPGAQGSIRMSGGGDVLNHIHFSAPVYDVYLALFSVGAPGVPVQFIFENSGPIKVLSQGPGKWGPGTLTLASDTTLVGEEGNGVVKVGSGYVSDIYFRTPDYEYFYGFEVGVTTVPEPASWAMLLAGLGLACALGRRPR